MDHLQLARALGKPTILEEYGIKVGRTQGDQGEVNRKVGPSDVTLTSDGTSSCCSTAAAPACRGCWPASTTKTKRATRTTISFAFYRDDATGKLVGDYAKAFANAPACQAQKPGGAPASPFVSVIHPAAARGARLARIAGAVKPGVSCKAGPPPPVGPAEPTPLRLRHGARGLLRLGTLERERERRALTELTLDRNAATHRLDQVLYDR